MTSFGLRLTCLAALAAPAALLPAPALAGQDAPSAGSWLRDPQGGIVGSVVRITDGGRTAVIMLGAYFQPGSREVSVPVGALTAAGGRTTLTGRSVEALNAGAVR